MLTQINIRKFLFELSRQPSIFLYIIVNSNQLRWYTQSSTLADHKSEKSAAPHQKKKGNQIVWITQNKVKNYFTMKNRK